MAVGAGSVYVEIGAVADQFNRSIEEVKAKLSGLGSEFEKASKRMTNIGQNMANAGKTLSMYVTAPLLALGGAALKSAADMEQSQVAFEVMLGSADKAKTMLEDLAKFAAKTPFALPDLQDAAKVMLNFGVAAGDIMQNLQMLGDVAGGDSQKLGQLALVFGQISANGKLMGGDLLQLVNAGFNPLMEMSKRTGVGMAELRKQMEQGAISADMVRESFKNATGPGGQFFGMMEKQSETLKGKFSTLLDTLSAFGRDLMAMVVPTVKEFVGGLTSVLEKFSGLDESTKKIILTLSLFAAALGPLLIIVGKLIQAKAALGLIMGAVKLAFAGEAAAAGSSTLALGAHAVASAAAGVASKIAAVAVTLFNAALKANPIGLVIGLVVSLVAGVYALISAFMSASSSQSAYEQTTRDLTDAKRGLLEVDQELTKSNDRYIEKMMEGGTSFSDMRQQMIDENDRLTASYEAMIQQEIEYKKQTGSTLIIRDKDEKKAKINANVQTLKRLEDLEYEHNKRIAGEKKRAREAWYRDAMSAREKYARLIEESGASVEQMEVIRYNREIAELEKANKAKYLKEEQYLQAKEAINKQHADNIQKINDDAFKRNSESFFSASSQISGQLGELFQMSAANEQASIENNQTKKLEKLNKEYEAEKAYIESTYTNSKERDEKLAALDKKRARDEKKINEQAEKEKRKIQRQAAKDARNIAIYETTIATAAAVMRAWQDTGPFGGPIYSAIIGALGAAKVALIAAQPLPVAAKGIYANSPYVGGEAGPELAFPLSSPNGTEALKLFSRQLLGELSQAQGSIQNIPRESAQMKMGDVYLDGQLVGEFVSKGTEDGRIRIYKRAVV